MTAVAAEARITPESYYTNDYFIGGAGYYHAPFHGFFARPYNDYDSARAQYFYGGQWHAAPHRSIINISSPTIEAARVAQSHRSDLRSSTFVPVPISRSGFGSTGRSHFTHS